MQDLSSTYRSFVGTDDVNSSPLSRLTTKASAPPFKLTATKIFIEGDHDANGLFSVRLMATVMVEVSPSRSDQREFALTLRQVVAQR